MKRGYITQFGRKAQDNDYVAKAFIDKVIFPRGVTHKAIVHVGKIHNGFAYFDNGEKVFAESLSADLISVVNPEDVKEYKRKEIEKIIKESLEKKQSERYFKIYSLTLEDNSFNTLYTKTSKLPLDTPSSDIKKYIEKIIKDRGIRSDAFQYREIKDEAEYLRLQRSKDTNEDPSAIEVSL